MLETRKKKKGADDFFEGADELGAKPKKPVRKLKPAVKTAKKEEKKEETSPKKRAVKKKRRDDFDSFFSEEDLSVQPEKAKGRKAGPAKKKKKDETKPESKRRLLAFNRDADGKLTGVYILGKRIRLHHIIAAALIVVLLAAIFFSNNNISLEEAELTVVGLPSDLEGYQIMVISDLNGKRYGDEQSSLLRTINNAGCDILLMCGDMVGKSGDADPLYELLDGLDSSISVYFICGDSDPGPYVSTPRDMTGTLTQLVLEDWILGAIERGATYVSSPVSITVGSSTLWLTPSLLLNFNIGDLQDSWDDQVSQEEDGTLANLDTDRETLPITSYRARIAENAYTALSSMEQDDFYICMSHEVPSDDLIRSAQTQDSVNGKYIPAPDLIVAGHYCGGVWQIPGIGAFYIPDDSLPRNGWFPDQSRVSGLRSVNDTHIFTSAGLGTNSSTVFPFRLFSFPKVSVITLSAQLQGSMLEE